MKAIQYLEKALFTSCPEAKVRYESYCTDDGGADLVAFMEDLKVDEDLVNALQDAIWKKAESRRLKELHDAVKQIKNGLATLGIVNVTASDLLGIKSDVKAIAKVVDFKL